MKRYFLSFIVIALICLTAACAVTTEEDSGGLGAFVGQWTCELYKMKSFEADLTLNIFNDGGTPKVLLSTDTFGFYFAPVVSSAYADGALTILLNSEEYRATIVLRHDGESRLTGTYSQYGETADIQFGQVSPVPEDNGFFQKTPEYTADERLQQLKEFAAFADDGVTIPFTYSLNEREPWEDAIAAYGLDDLTEGKTDVELMKALLLWVSDNFKHGNPAGAPGKAPDAMSVIEFCGTTGGYTNCRGLSLILADLCRVYGIPAKHVTCMPMETNFNDCHVVVVAYSYELEQWVMLDPTYKLIPRDENGNYLDLRALRECLVNDSEIIPNGEFSYNGGPISIDYYRGYMAKNTFRFSTATDFYYGAEESRNENVRNMLIPAGYDGDRAKRTTTSDDAFWAAP